VLSSECDSHALAIRLNFLARQLEMERAQREKLNAQVAHLENEITLQKHDARREVNKNMKEKAMRETAVKQLDTGLQFEKTF
jgi:hypothetical protein